MSMKVYCSHCGIMLSDRTVRQHKRDYWDSDNHVWKEVLNNMPAEPVHDKRPDVLLRDFDRAQTAKRRRTDNHQDSPSMEHNSESKGQEAPDMKDGNASDDPEVDDPAVEHHHGVEQDASAAVPGSGYFKSHPSRSQLKDWFHHTLRVWQVSFGVSVTALRVLMTILYVFLVVMGMCGNQAADTFIIDPPNSGDPLVGVIGRADDNVHEWVKCAKCHTLYRHKDCYTEIRRVERWGTTQTKHRKPLQCQHKEFPNHPQDRHRQPCGGDLVKLAAQKKVVAVNEQLPYSCVIESIRRLVQRPGIRPELDKWKTRMNDPDFMFDVYDGDLWKENQEFLCRDVNLAFMLNIDWLQPYERSNYSLGVVYLCCLNLPRDKRYDLENIIVVCTLPHESQHNKSLPKMLNPLVDSLLKMWTDGFKTVQGEQVRAMLLLVSCDLPAARSTMGFISHNGFMGCSKCNKKFGWIDNNNKNKRNYGGFESDGPTNQNNTHRTGAEHRTAAAQHLGAASQAERDRIAQECGCRWSPFLRLPYFDVIRSTVIDPMHCLYLGIAKHVLRLWFANGIIGDELEAALNSVNVPRWIGRVVSAFSGDNSKKQAKSLKRLKAAEVKDFVLIYSLPVLYHLLVTKGNNQDHYDMWVHFHKACLLSSSYCVDRRQLPTMQNEMYQFLIKFERLFGTEKCVPNLHMGLELMVHDISAVGPNHVIWCFAFERLNGVLADFHTNRRNICTTILRLCLEYQRSRDEIRCWRMATGDTRSDSLRRVWNALNRQHTDGFDKIEWDTLLDSMGPHGYWACVRSIGMTEIGWDEKPALLVNSVTNISSHDLRLSEDHHRELEAYLRDHYKWWMDAEYESCMDPQASISVLRTLAGKSNKLQYFHSVIGSYNTQSSSASYILVQYGDKDDQKKEELPARVEFFAQALVTHTPTPIAGVTGRLKAKFENFKEETSQCQQSRGVDNERVLVARVMFFRKPDDNVSGPGCQKWNRRIDPSLSRPVWVLINQISAQFIPYYPEDGDYMYVCRVAIRAVL